MKTLSKHISESILASSHAGKAGIDALYKKYGLNPDWVTTNSDGTINYNGSIYWRNASMPKLPFRFNIVTGSMIIDNCGLTTLEGAPKEVFNSFKVYNNDLTSLEGAPKYVGGSFSCINNKIKTLEGGPEEVGGSYYCQYNYLTSLKGAPAKINGDFDCTHNELTSLKGCPEKIRDMFDCSYNPLTSFEHGPKNAKKYIAIDAHSTLSYDATIDEIHKYTKTSSIKA